MFFATRSKSVQCRFRPQPEQLETRVVPAAFLFFGTDADPRQVLPGIVTIAVDQNENGQLDEGEPIHSFIPYEGFMGGVRVASGDFTGNGIPELVTAAGPGGGPRVTIWELNLDGTIKGVIDDFFAFDPNFTGGVNIAAGELIDFDFFNFNVPGKTQLVTAADSGGGPHVKIWGDRDGDGHLDPVPLDSFFAYNPNFRGGVRVAIGGTLFGATNFPDSPTIVVHGNLITAAGPGGGPHVKIWEDRDFDGKVSNDPLIASFFAFAPHFTGGVYVASGGGLSFVTAAGAGGGPHVKVWRTSIDFITLEPQVALTDSFFAYDPNFTGGVRVAYGPTFDGDILVTVPGPGGGSHLKIFFDSNENDQFSDEPPVFSELLTPQLDELAELSGLNKFALRKYIATGGFTGGLFVSIFVD